MAEERKWEGKTDGGNFGQKFLLWALHRVNVCWLYPLLVVAIPFYLLFGREGRKASYHYFRDRHQFSFWKSCWYVLKNHICFGAVVLDKFALIAGNKGQYKALVTNDDIIQQKLNQPGGFLIAGAHVGNLEMSGLCVPHAQKRINSIIFGGESGDFQKKRIEAFTQSEMNMIPVEEDMSHLFAIKEALEKEEVVVIPCDRVWGSSKVVSTPFLNGEAEFPVGTFRLAAQLDVPVMVLFIFKEKWNTYRVLSKELKLTDEYSNSIQKSTTYCKAYVKELETVVREYPEQWFNFYPFWKS